MTGDEDDDGQMVSFEPGDILLMIATLSNAVGYLGAANFHLARGQTAEAEEVNRKALKAVERIEAIFRDQLGVEAARDDR